MLLSDFELDIPFVDLINFVPTLAILSVDHSISSPNCGVLRNLISSDIKRNPIIPGSTKV